MLLAETEMSDFVPVSLTQRYRLAVFFFCGARYLPSRSAYLFRAAAGIMSGWVWIACFSADPHLQARVFGMLATALRTTSQALLAFWFRTAITWSTVTASCPGCQQS